MKHVICTFAPATRNEHRTYFVRLNKYAVIRETACFFYVLDEMGFERRVSKKTSNETGYKAGHAAEFSEIMEQAEAVDTVEAAAARRQYAAFTAAEKTEAEAMNAADVVTGETVRVGQVIEDAKGSRFVVTQVMRMAGYTDASGHVEGTYFPVTHGYRSIRFNTCNAASIAYGVKFTRLIKDVEPAPTATEAVSRRDAIETMIENMDDAISDRDILAAREWKADIKAAVEADHAEALEEDAQREMDKPAFRAFWAASDFSVMVNALEAFNAAHAEALELDAEHAAAQLIGEAIRLANRDHGHWITGAQVAAMLTDGKEYTAAQLARAVVNQAKEAAQLEQYAAQLVAGQHDYTTAADASEAALNAAVEASTDGTEDTPEFAAYEAAEETLTEKTTALLQACGRYAVELAHKMGKTASEVDALKQMFMPAVTGNTGSMHPGRRNELVAKALAINPTQAA